VTTHLLFDFFGTLVDYSPSRTEQGYGRSFGLLREAGMGLDYPRFLALWSEVSEELDARAEETHREFSMMEAGRAFLSRAMGSWEDGLVGDFVRTYLVEWNEGVTYHPGLPALLQKLGERYALAVITNTHDAGLVPAHLEQMGIAHHFDAVVTSIGFGMRKPAPEIFQHTLRLLGAEADQCVYVGDDYDADYCGARSAGLRPLLVDPLGEVRVPESDRLGSILALDRHLLDPA
jgi:putative hydrolase of the HAD superfamily